uniref:DNA-directed RNA polymerases I and III subunit RPAC1 n=1 Tax=Acrobeloides nanus TaxID=290746 RepID=A0A914CFK0_9BILA
MGRRKKSSTTHDMEVDQSEATSSGAEALYTDDDTLYLEEETVTNTYDREYESLDIDAYTEKIKVEIINEIDEHVNNKPVKGLNLEFDLIHVDAPIANALRRILIAEVPTMAIEKVYLYQNTTCLQDEVLCHRLGLLPIYADPNKFKFPSKPFVPANEEGVDPDEEPAGNPEENLIFKVQVKCTKKKNPPENSTDPTALYENAVVYTDAFEWIPLGDQINEFGRDPPRMVHKDIIVVKMRPGHELEASCHCVKGIGRDHAKFSPVATASYRLLPMIKLKKNITGEQAERLQKCFSDGVIALYEEKGTVVAKVADARKDTCSRNVFRFDDLKELVEMKRKKDHFIFSVESTGAMKSHELVVEACHVMQKKIETLKEALKAKLGVH